MRSTSFRDLVKDVAERLGAQLNINERREFRAGAYDRVLGSLESKSRYDTQVREAVIERLSIKGSPNLELHKGLLELSRRPEGIRQLVTTNFDNSEAETRDYAIVLTFYCLGLRVSELCSLMLEDTDLERGNTWIKAKGRRERELVPLPGAVTDAMRRYLTHRGAGAGPLFQTRGQRGRRRDGRLETRSVLRIVRELGQRVGLHLWCHGLRHTAITTAIEKGQQAGVGLDQIRAFSRHRTLATMLIYRDEHDRAATQRTLADVVASSLDLPVPGSRPEAV